MKIGVIIPLYKGNKYVKKIVGMFEKMSDNEGICEIEIIFINDYPEEKISYVSESEIGIRYVENEKNLGIHLSRIQGINATDAEYIIFLDQDDELDGDFLSEVTPFIHNNDLIVWNGTWRNGEKIFRIGEDIVDRCSFDGYLLRGYPLVSLGQMLVKKSCIPMIWMNNPLKCNGWDDHFLWMSLMRKTLKIKYFDKIFYHHNEDGNNQSFNWSAMASSGQEFMKIALERSNLNDMERKRFTNLVEKKIDKYLKYAEINRLFELCDMSRLENFFREVNETRIIIYGYGIWGKKIEEKLQEVGRRTFGYIDNNANLKGREKKYISIEDCCENDLIIVTPIMEYASIYEEILEKKDIRVFSLEDVLKDCCSESIRK